MKQLLVLALALTSLSSFADSSECYDSNGREAIVDIYSCKISKGGTIKSDPINTKDVITLRGEKCRGFNFLTGTVNVPLFGGFTPVSTSYGRVDKIILQNDRDPDLRMVFLNSGNRYKKKLSAAILILPNNLEQAIGGVTNSIYYNLDCKQNYDVDALRNKYHNPIRL